LFYSNADGRCCLTAPSSPKIPFSSASNRLPSNIPLRTLPGQHSRSSAADHQSTSLLRPSSSGHPADVPRSDDSSDSESWLDTGDIAEQLADQDDPLRARLHDTLDDDVLAGLLKRNPHPHTQAAAKQPKRVRYHHSVPSPGRGSPTTARPGVVNKEAIEIPDSVVRRASVAQRLLAAIMPGTGLHGLTGKPLMYTSHPEPLAFRAPVGELTTPT